MQYQVPQFIEVEDKIFGPLTIKQFIYLVGGAGVAFALYVFLPFFFAILFGAPIVALALALAFYRINNRPFIDIAESAVKYFFGHRLYIWKKGTPVREEVKATPQETKPLVPKISESKLKDLAWSLDIKESLYSSRDQQK